VAVVTLIAALVIGFWVHGISLTAGVLAILTVVVGLTLLLGANRRPPDWKAARRN
jgi:hypothetical protein